MIISLILSFFIFGTLCGSSCYDLAKKKGRDPEAGFALGLLLQAIGLIIMILLPYKNGNNPESHILKRLLFGIIRFIITLTLLSVLIPFVQNGRSELSSAIGVSGSIIVLTLLTYGLNVIGIIWTLRGKNCLSLGFPQSTDEEVKETK